MPTPPAISTVIAMLMHKLVKNEKIEIVDPTIGTGILLFSIISQLKALNHSKDNYQLVGIDNDEEMLNLADVAAHLNDFDIELYCQDALMPWMCSNPDVVISDLPIGYYPVDENAKNFENRAEKGHSFAHLLLIEQIIKNLKPAGYAFLVVPKSILSGKIGADFMPWLTKKVYLKAIVELPDDMFKNKFNQKSILVFQNHGEDAKASEVLLTKLDSLKKELTVAETRRNQAAMEMVRQNSDYDHALEQLATEYRITLDEARASGDLLDESDAALRRRELRLEREIETLGSVNPAAIEQEL